MEGRMGNEKGQVMKVRATINLNVTMGNALHDGTGFQGYLPEGTRYEDIVRVFGTPQFRESSDGKIKAEWAGRINGLVFTIYDYKSRLEPERNTDWHVGGKGKFVAELVTIYFSAKK